MDDTTTRLVLGGMAGAEYLRQLSELLGERDGRSVRPSRDQPAGRVLGVQSAQEHRDQAATTQAAERDEATRSAPRHDVEGWGYGELLHSV